MLSTNCCGCHWQSALLDGALGLYFSSFVACYHSGTRVMLNPALDTETHKSIIFSKFQSIVSLQCPSTCYYISSFLSQKDEELIISQVDNTPKPKWTQLSNRRVINYGGVPHPNGMIAEDIPKWLKDRVVTLNNLGE